MNKNIDFVFQNNYQILIIKYSMNININFFIIIYDRFKLTF